MRLRYRLLQTLLGSTTILVSTPCFAQAADAPPAPDSTGMDIVVTATKQSTPLSRVPISISALSQDTMDQANIRSFADIVRVVPGLSIQTDASADRIPNISIRGIASSSGAATTGIYVDDVPLQKRNAIGISGSGTPIPHLFDLERVEVLRGPQGTLFGGSSLGGAIRFVTPEPDLDKVTLYARSEVSSTKSGGVGFGQGIAMSYPLIPGTLALRVSGDVQRTAGYIDHVNRFTGDVIEKNTNSAQAGSYRAALLFEPNAGLKITPSFYYSYDHSDDSDAQWSSIPETTLDGYTYAAATFGKYQSGNNCNVGDDYASSQICSVKQPRKQRFFVPSLKVEGDFGFADVTSISSYIDDRTTGKADYSYVEPANFQGGYPFVHNLALYSSTPVYENTRTGFTQELRLASKPGSRLGWLVGGFFSHYKNNSNYHIVANIADLTQAVWGLDPIDVFGVDVEPGNVTYHRDQDLKEESLAGFGEVNYQVTDKFKVIAGARVSRESFSYHQETAGLFAGYTVPTTENGGLTDGKVKETPVTPRFGLQYQFDSRTMFYATASKGFRVGGVNQPPPAARCEADLDMLGITSTPGTYKSDHLWSYEAGVKGRTANGAVSFDANAFYIDWSRIQVSYGLPTCGFGYVINGGKAVSRGADIQAAVRPVEGLTLSGEFAYTDAYYDRAVVGDAPGNTLYVAKGDKLPVPRYRINLNLDYTREVGGFEAYLRAGYQHASSYQNGTGPETASYYPDTWQVGATDFVTARIGFGRDGWDLSVFADNLFNSSDVLGRSNGRTGCAAGSGEACATYEQYTSPLLYTTFRPRTLGLTFTLRK